jgi:hypothetical protein
MKPPTTPRESGIGIDQSDWNRHIAEQLLRLGDRAHRRAAGRWLVRHRIKAGPVRRPEK